jgi:dTDP-4-dehydrorhamnose 3,5-epimerase
MDDLILIDLNIINDERGFFYEAYNFNKLKELGISHTFLQDNCSRSLKAGTVRGLHCQTLPTPQAKLIRCSRGKIIDVAVDVRVGSPNFGKYAFFELSEDSASMLYIPVGFLHGFITLVDNTEVIYKCSDVFDLSCDRSVAFNDPLFNINWPEFESDYIMSPKDCNAKKFHEQDIEFPFLG